MNIMSHERVEKSVVILGLLTFFAVIWGGLVQIVPLFFDDQMHPKDGYVKPYEPLRLAGFNIYVREGCYGCHSQMIRPFQWGSKRTGPDLARVGGKYGDDWHHKHLTDPRSVVLESNMPAYPWLNKRPANVELTKASIRTKIKLGEPYTQADIDSVDEALKDKTEMDALVAYLQGLGIAFKEHNR